MLVRSKESDILFDKWYIIQPHKYVDFHNDTLQSLMENELLKILFKQIIETV